VIQFNIYSIFPEFFQSPLSAGLTSKAVEKGLLKFHLVNPRDYSQSKHKTVDDRPFGGGDGMCFMAEPWASAIEQNPVDELICFSPQGERLTAKMAHTFAQSLLANASKPTHPAVGLLCGRYAGFDKRLIVAAGAREISVGDYVLNGGETAALVFIEAVSRFVPGFLGHGESAAQDSFSEGVGGLLEGPTFTRPEVWRDLEVPSVLTGGHHGEIAKFRRRASLVETWLFRRDLLMGKGPSRGGQPTLESGMEGAARVESSTDDGTPLSPMAFRRPVRTSKALTEEIEEALVWARELPENVKKSMGWQGKV